MSAGIEKPSFSSGLAIANGGLSCSLFWFGQPDSNDPRHPERNKIDSKKNDHARVRAPLTLDHKPSEVSTSPAANRPMYQMMSNMRLLLSWNCPLVHEHSTDRSRSARLPRRRRVHFSDMGKGLTAFFLGKTNRPPSLDFCVLALDIAGFTEPRRNITKGAA